MSHINYEVLIVGGGPAGLSAALTLGRGNRTVLICDTGAARNAPAAHMQNFPSREGTPPLEFRQKILTELEAYPHVQHQKTRVLDLERQGRNFRAKLENGEQVLVRKVLIASGIRDKLPDIPGIKELWGKSVFHCPYCHGYEFKNKPFALIGDIDYLMHMGALAKGLSETVSFFSNGPTEVSEQQRAILNKQRISLYQEKIKSLEYDQDQVRFINLENGLKVPCEAILVKTQLQQQSDLADKFLCEKTDLGFYKVDVLKRSSAAGISIAGDLTEMIQSVLVACQTGQVAGAGINYDILHENWLEL